jgi:hypothetical protein
MRRHPSRHRPHGHARPCSGSIIRRTPHLIGQVLTPADSGTGCVVMAGLVPAIHVLRM